jgi:multidrug resistance efflux pump
MTKHSEATELGNTPALSRDAESACARQESAPFEAVSPQKPKETRRRQLVIGGAGVVVLALVLGFGIPWTIDSLNTVSTDDAFVNGHVTFVAARVRGQVARVLVDDNNRVRRGNLLDKEPYRTAVAIKKAAVDTAEADLRAATATPRHRSGSQGPAVETAARHRRRRQAGSRTAHPGRRDRQGQGGARLGRARIRAGAAAGGDEQRSAVRVRPAAGDPGGGPRKSGPGPGQCEPDPRLEGEGWTRASSLK